MLGGATYERVRTPIVDCGGVQARACAHGADKVELSDSAFHELERDSQGDFVTGARFGDASRSHNIIIHEIGRIWDASNNNKHSRTKPFDGNREAFAIAFSAWFLVPEFAKDQDKAQQIQIQNLINQLIISDNPGGPSR